MSILLLFCALSVPACLVLHEGGHWLAARLFGEKLKFTFSLGKLFGIVLVPRWVWYMPHSFAYGQRAITALSGFGLELAATATLYATTGAPWAFLVALAHLGLYNFYAGDANDFKNLRK